MNLNYDCLKITWDRDSVSRNAMYSQVVLYLEGDQKANLGEVLLISDIDEIPKPLVLKAMRDCDIPDRNYIHSEFYYYGSSS